MKQEEFDTQEGFEEEFLILMPNSTQPVDTHKEFQGGLNKKTAVEKIDLESKYYVVASMDLASGSQENAEPLTKLASDSKDTTKPLYKSPDILKNSRGHCLSSEAELEGLQKTKNIDSEAGLVAALEGLTLVTSKNSGKLSEQCADNSLSTVDLFKNEIDHPGYMEDMENKPKIELAPKTNLDKLKKHSFNDFASSFDLFGSGLRTKTNETEVVAELKIKTNDSETEVKDGGSDLYNKHEYTNDTKPKNMPAPVQPPTHQMFNHYYGHNIYPFGVCSPHPHALLSNDFQNATEQQQNVTPSLPKVPYVQHYNVPLTHNILLPTHNTVPQTQISVPQTQINVPQAQINVPQAQINVPQAQINVPQTQMNVPQTQINVPQAQINVPQAQISVPQAQINIPQAQMNVPQAQMNVPQAQINVPQAQMNVPQAQMNVPQAQMNVPQSYYNAPPSYYNVPPTHYIAPPMHCNVPHANYNAPQTLYPMTSPSYIMIPHGYVPWNNFYQLPFVPNENPNMYYASPERNGPMQDNNCKLNKNTCDDDQSQGQISGEMKQQSEMSQPSKANRNKKVEELEASTSCKMFGYSKNFDKEEDSQDKIYTKLIHTEEPIYDEIQSDTEGGSLQIFTNVGENDMEKNIDLHPENVSTEAQQKMVCVKGFTQMQSKEALEFFFENKKRSGGGDIETLEINVHKNEVLIEFCEHLDAASVVQKCKSDGGFKVFDCKLNAVMYTPPSVDPYKIFIKNIHEKTSQECLENFVEARCRSTPTEVVYGDTPGTAIVTFSQPYKNLKNIKMEFGKKTCDGQLLEMMEVEETKSVKVQCQQPISSQALMFYLENVRRSNGGDVDKVDVHEQANTYIVTFVNTSDALRVCQKKVHNFDDNVLKVSLHYTCLDMDPSFVVTIPAPLTFDNLDPHLVKFLCHSAVYHVKLENEIVKCYGKIVWPSQSSDILQVTCVVDKNDKDGRNKVKSWGMCTTIVDKVSQEIRVNRDLNIAHENWLETITKLHEISVKDVELVMVFLENADKSIIIVGQTGLCEDLTKQIQKIVSEIEQKLDEENHVVTKQKRIKMYEILLLRACRFDTAMQKKGVEVTMNNESKIITFKGIQRTVNTQMQEMRDQLNNFARRKITGLSELAKNLLYDTETRNYVKKKLSEKKIIGVWDRIRGQDMFMFSKTEDDVKTAISIVKESIKDISIPLTSNMHQLINSEERKAVITEIQEKYKGVMRMEISKEEILLAVIDHKENDIKDAILKYLDEQSVVTDVLEPDLGRFVYLMTYQKHQFECIEEQLKNLDVTIQTKNSGFQIHGKKECYKIAVKLLQKLLDGIHQKEHIVSWPGFSKFLQSPIGKDTIHSIENLEKCICKVSYLSVADAGSEISYPNKCAMFQIGNCELVVYHGNMLSAKVDAIVNPSWNNLAHSVGLGKEIVDKGGFSIQKECNEYLREQHFMKEGSVFTSKAGKLPFRGILHVVIPQWRGGDGEDDILALAITNCLLAAEQEGFYQVAFPTVGTGTFKFPLQKAVQILVKSIDVYLNKTTYSKLTSIAICEIKEDILDFVMGACNKVFVKPVQNSEYTMETRSGTRNSMATTKIIQTKIVVGSLASQNVDVIVNSTNQYMDLSVGTVSRVLLATGGDGLQDECKVKYPDGINIGQIAVTSGHKLSCKNVFHIMIPKWSQGQGYCRKVMSEFMDKCLTMADTYKFNSIAFPALGTGILDYPPDVVANLFYSVISTYETTNPNTNLRLICFVLWAGDNSVIKAFHDAKSGLDHHGREKPNSLKLSDYDYQPFKQTVTLKARSHMIGPVTLTVCQNDITKEKTEAIVNSTTKDFNLSTGIVSNTILKEAGTAIQTECNAQGKDKKMCVTSAGKLNCQKIIHLSARNSAKKWQTSIVMCLNEVENLGFSSVSFPALGTGGKAMNPETIAKTFVSAILEHTESKQFRKCLKTVRIVIYETEMVPVFEKAVKAALELHTSSPRKSHLPDLKFWKRLNEEDRVSIHIYTDSAYHAEGVVRRLENIMVTEKILLTKIVKDRVDKKMQAFKNAGKERIVKVKKEADQIVLTGYAKSCVTEVKTFIEKYLDKLHKEIILSKVSSSVTLPCTWSKMALTDPLKIDVLQNTDADFVMVSTKFLSETQNFNIIKIERIQNPALYMQYIGKKREMEQKISGQKIEQLLWHGTKGDTVANINSKGFNRNYNTGSSYGIGVYFAVKATMSATGYSHPDASGNRHIYLAYVLTGDYCVAKGAIRVPPAKGTNAFDTFDTTCDNVATPNLFVIYHDAQAYPSFHIVFK